MLTFKNFQLFSLNALIKYKSNVAVEPHRPMSKASTIYVINRLTVNLLVGSDGKAKLVINQSS